jgi:iron complex outermembrane receptor protein
MRVMTRTAAAVGIVVVLAGPARAAAQSAPPVDQSLPNMSLEELMDVRIQPVFGASLRLQPVTEAPASVTIVTAEDIARYGYRTLADILQSVRGFQVSDDRNYSYVGTRGFAIPGDYNTRILLLVDGHRLNDNIYGQAQAGAELGLDPGTFERVEIIRGAASSLYGTSAFLAVVNIVTKTGAALAGGAVTIETGSFGGRTARAAFGRRLSTGLDYSLFAAYSASSGQDLRFPEFEADGAAAGLAAKLDDETMTSVSGRLNSGAFTLSGAVGRREKGVPTAAFGTVFGDARFRTTDTHAFLDLAYDQAFGSTRTSVRGYVDRYRYDGTYPGPGWEDTPPVVLYDDYADGLWIGVDGRVTRPLGSRHVLTLGAEARDDVRQDQGGAYEGDAAPAFDISGRSSVLAGFAQDEIKLSPRWLLNAGLRYDAYSGFSRLAPRVGLIFNSSPNQAFKYLYGNAFRAPNAYERDYYSHDSGDPSLRAETVDSHELVWERYTGRWLRTAMSAYTSEVSNLITLVSDDEGGLTFTNRGRSRATGLEAEGEVRLPGGLESTASYEIRGTEGADGATMTNSPRHTGKLRMSAPFAGGLIAAFDLRVVSERRTLGGSTVGPAAIANVNLRWNAGDHLTLSAGVRNLFDRRFADPGSEEHLQDAIQQDGRSVRVGLEWRFREK